MLRHECVDRESKGAECYVDDRAEVHITYHAEGSDSALRQGDFLAQEKALMHILLEVGVCVGEKPVPLVR